MATIIALACTLLLFPALATSREVCHATCAKTRRCKPQPAQRPPRRLQLSSQPGPSTANTNPLKDLADHFVEIHGGEFVVNCQVWVRWSQIHDDHHLVMYHHRNLWASTSGR